MNEREAIEAITKELTTMFAAVERAQEACAELHRLRPEPPSPTMRRAEAKWNVDIGNPTDADMDAVLIGLALEATERAVDVAFNAACQAELRNSRRTP